MVMVMKTVTQRVGGQLLAGDGRYALRLDNHKPEKGAANLLYLRFAFVTQEMDELIFPAFILDDWGSEIKSLALYEWFHEFAVQFPRAEVFGRNMAGQETQRFLRELEPYSKLPCYAYPTPDTPLADGRLVEFILIPDETIQESIACKRPSKWKRPLRSAKARWQRVPTGASTFEYAPPIIK